MNTFRKETYELMQATLANHDKFTESMFSEKFWTYIITRYILFVGWTTKKQCFSKEPASYFFITEEIEGGSKFSKWLL